MYTELARLYSSDASIKMLYYKQYISIQLKTMPVHERGDTVGFECTWVG